MRWVSTEGRRHRALAPLQGPAGHGLGPRAALTSCVCWEGCLDHLKQVGRAPLLVGSHPPSRAREGWRLGSPCRHASLQSLSMARPASCQSRPRRGEGCSQPAHPPTSQRHNLAITCSCLCPGLDTGLPLAEMGQPGTGPPGAWDRSPPARGQLSGWRAVLNALLAAPLFHPVLAWPLVPIASAWASGVVWVCVSPS